MIRHTYSLTLVLAVAALAACDSAVPQASDRGAVLPSIAPRSQIAALAAPAPDEAAAEVPACEDWVQTEDTWDGVTGAFHSVWQCESEGVVQRSITDGVQNADGSGSFTRSFEVDGVVIEVWSFNFTTSADGLTQTYDATSDQGGTYQGSYVYAEDGSSTVHEVWTLAEGTYLIDGAYDAEGNFTGTTRFDDPATEASPDYVVQDSRLDDGGLRQEVNSQGDGFTSHYIADFSADGVTHYTFETDDGSSAVNPDWVGEYTWDISGAGSGGYTQSFDDGSLLAVSDTFGGDGSTDES
ncbi:MAG: hypothetical protein IT383_00025 [Deltaproteobacteria bacterium]|nr:hypothetical protein [Deltaproteobacteria bacterium]